MKKIFTFLLATSFVATNLNSQNSLFATQTRNVEDNKYVPNGHKFVSNADWTVIAFDSEEPSNGEGAGGGKAIHAIDGNTSTYWHTQWSNNTQPAHPHYISVDMGKEETIGLFQYVPRPGGHNGTVKGYKLYLSDEEPSYPDNLGALIAEGEFTGDKTEAKDITFAETKARYFTFVATSAVGGEVFASAGELRVGKPGTAWSVVEVDSNEPQEAAHGGYGKHAIDNNLNTYWHTQWWDPAEKKASEAPLPHYIIVDLGKSFSISGFEYFPRQDKGTNGTVKGYEFYLSDDYNNWGDAVSTGEFNKEAGDKTAREVSFATKKGRYFKFVATSEIRPAGNVSAVAEIRLISDNNAGIQEISSDLKIWYANRYLNISNWVGTAFLNIFNMQGQILLSRKINSNKSTIPIDLNSGIYTVVLSTPKGKMIINKIVVK